MDSALAAMLTVPAILAALAFLVGQHAPRRFAQAAALTAGLGFLGAVALAAGSSRDATVSATVLGAEFNVDRLAAVLLMLVFGVSAIVQAYAVRYLTGDPRAAWFTGGAGLLTAASAGLSTAATLITLAVCWTLAGLALCLLLATYWHLPAARDGVRRTVTAFVIGDVALWVAVGTATAIWGRIDLRATEITGAVPAILGVLVVLAALSRSAQIPFHRWLPATLAAPTPVSALLHAGVVNAGAILLIRTAPLATDDLARALTIIAGAATMAYGATIMLVKPDIKGALAHSTTAQMGFMILTCGLGLWAAAVIHLVAHGFYKATLFLSSGSAIAGHRRQSSLPPVHRLTRRQAVVNAVAAVTVPAAALAAALAVVPLGPGEHAAEHALLIFAWVTGASVTWGWLRRRPGLSGVLAGAAVLVPAAVGYVAIINALSEFLSPALPVPTLPAAAVWAITAAAALALGVLALARRAPAADRLRRVVYTSALSAGHLPSPRTSPVLLTGARS
jgi:NAD(P)H-quinone oxidoreductase subunit 5